jgi:hypothetical protein
MDARWTGGGGSTSRGPARHAAGRHEDYFRNAWVALIVARFRRTTNSEKSSAGFDRPGINF